MKELFTSIVIVALAAVLTGCVATEGFIGSHRETAGTRASARGSRVTLQNVTVTQPSGATVPALVISIGSADVDNDEIGQTGAEISPTTTAEGNNVN